MGKVEEGLLERLALLVAQRLRGQPLPPPLVSDARRGYPQALVNAPARVPPYRGRGRPPKKKRPPPGLRRAQLVKHRRRGRVVAVTERIVFGEPTEVRRGLGAVNLSRVERTHLTSRQSNGRLVRKALSFSKCRQMLEWACAWEDVVYNFVKPVRTLRLRVGRSSAWRKRTPAMAAGVTDHIWTVRELASLIVPPLSQVQLHLVG